MADTCTEIRRAHLAPLDGMSNASRCRVLSQRCMSQAVQAERAGRREDADRLARLSAFWADGVRFWAQGKEEVCDAAQ